MFSTLYGTYFSFQPFPKRQILDSSKLKGSADDNFEFDESGRIFSKRVENTGKRRNTSNFSFSHSVFKRLILQTHKKPGLVWERVKCTLKCPQFVLIWTSLKFCRPVMG